MCFTENQIKICKLKPNFVSRDKVISIFAKRIFDCIVPSSTTSKCDISCSRYSLQYVGETAQKLNKRFNWHRTGFNQPDNYGFCCILSDHSHNGVCCNASSLVQILEKLEGNSRTARNALDAEIKNRLSLWFKLSSRG